MKKVVSVGYYRAEHRQIIRITPPWPDVFTSLLPIEGNLREAASYLRLPTRCDPLSPFSPLPLATLQPTPLHQLGQLGTISP